MIDRDVLIKLYVDKKMSAKDIAKHLEFSENKIIYWMNKHNIQRRSISEAVYTKHHPKGDPFVVIEPKTTEERLLHGLGIGLYWGEGTKASKDSVRLGNSDPDLILKFMQFLITLYGVKKSDLRFGLQLFSDIDIDEALSYWQKTLKVNNNQFYKPYVTITGSVGTYRKKSKYGVLTLYYNNKKLRDILYNSIPSDFKNNS